MVFSFPHHSAAQHRNVVDAAKRAGVELLAYTSVLHAATSPLALALAGEHRATEAAILASGLASTFLRNGWYLENYTAQLAPCWRVAPCSAASATAASTLAQAGLAAA